MSTGIKIEGGGGHTLSWNIVSGYGTGISIEDSWNNVLSGNIVISKEAVNKYGEGINDLASKIRQSRDYEALTAFESIMSLEPDATVPAWIILIKKFGVKVGRFSFDILKGVLSSAAYSILRTSLEQSGIKL